MRDRILPSRCILERSLVDDRTFSGLGALGLSGLDPYRHAVRRGEEPLEGFVRIEAGPPNILPDASSLCG